METHELEHYGDALETIVDMESRLTTQFFVVQYAGQVVGVAIYHNHSPNCTLALVQDELRQEMILFADDATDHVSAGEMDQLEHYYGTLFPAQQR